MTPQDTVEAEAAAAYEAYVETRLRIEAGDLPWSALAERHFTDGAVFIDPAYGRAEGRQAIAAFLDESMLGLDGWTFPREWTMVDGSRVVTFWWNRLPGERADGTPYQAAAVSILTYDADGRFSREHDILNTAEVVELIEESGWAPSGAMNMPPERPDRRTA